MGMMERRPSPVLPLLAVTKQSARWHHAFRKQCAVGIQTVVWPLVVTSGPDKTPDACFELPMHTTEPARGARGFISASWAACDFFFFHKTSTSTFKLKPLTIK
jgi:hypothetical protein